MIMKYNSMKKFIILLSVLIFLPATGIISEREESYYIGHFENIGHFEKTVYIKAGGDFYFHFNKSNGLEFKSISFNLSEKAMKAVLRAPEWMQIKLARQFERIGDEYADLILNSPSKYVDEIAFSIACCPSNAVPPPGLLYDNAYFIYKNDELIDYADVIDFENGSSTIVYRVLEDGQEKEYTCPMKIYYWYVVHPRITFEDAEYVYDKFWREYLFYHNDIGYPLLMEKLRGIEYLWDCQSYHPPSHRTWKWSMENHPTAIEAVSYWIGKTINQLAIGDRPGQPNVIAHEHNGYCGELQQIAVAAQRTALIPSVGINNLGEDHVWREFWHNGWHECDNWWADGGGSVDNYDEYRYRWNKIVSAFFAWNGDSSIYDVTSKYIKPEDRAKVIVEVKDIFGNNVDGVRVMVFGTWKANNFKDKLWNKYIEKLWQKLPSELRQRWQEKYDEIKKFYRERVPGIIPWIIPSIWNYTNSDGICSFNLGLGHSYLFVLQKDDVFYFGPYSVGKSNAFHYCLALRANSTKEIKIKFILPDYKEKLGMEIANYPNEGEYSFKINFNCKGYQEQRNPWDWKYSYGVTKAKVNFLVLDKENFNRYRKGEQFICYKYMHAENGSIEINGDDLYFVFNNSQKRTDIILNVDFSIYGKGDFIHIAKPCSNISTHIISDAGLIKIEGFSTKNGEVEIDGKKWDVYGNFSILWNASVGKHILKARCGGFEKNYEIEVVDFTPPKIVIDEPEENGIGNKLVIKGYATDNVGIKEIKVKILGEEMLVENPFNESISLPPGDYEILFTAVDKSGLESKEKRRFTIVGNQSKPLIKEIYYEPSFPTNESNIVVYAYVEKTFYELKKVSIILNGEEKNMYRYADFPVQSRHEEDALKNISNEPRYGIELGQLEKGEYEFIIKAIDTVGNVAVSEEYKIEVG